MTVTQEAVIQKLDELIEIASKNDSVVHDNLARCKDRFVHPSYRIVLLGTFTSGKSTLINAFLGEDLLPTGLVPTTRAILELSHGPQVAAVEVRSDGEEVPLRIDDLKSKGVVFAEDGSYLRLYSNHDFVSNGLVIIDTPGLQDTNERAYELTLNEIPKADAVLMLFNAEVAGYGEAEREFLENVVLPNDVNRKFFPVCNKIDLLSKDGEVERLLKWLREQLPRRLGDRRVIPVSARWALEGRLQAKPELIEKSRIRDLEESIQDFLKTNSPTTALMVH